MEIQVQELIDKIKRDGIASASEEASRVKSQAESDAGRITDAAQREAQAIIARAKADAERFEKAGIAAVEQASRNLILAFKGEIEALLGRIIAARVENSYGEDTLKAIIPDLVKNWALKGADSVDVILSEDKLGALRGYFNQELAAEISKGVELKSDRNLGEGFRIAGKDGAAYYDFSAESVAALLSVYLNPRLQAILKTAAKGN